MVFVLGGPSPFGLTYSFAKFRPQICPGFKLFESETQSESRLLVLLSKLFIRR